MTAETRAASPATDAQRVVRLTPHPLQRVGAHALAAIAAGKRKESRPIPLDQLTPDLFDDAVTRMAKDAIRAAKSGKEDFWRKSTYALFPNSKINHPSAGRRSVLENEKLIRAWRTMPEPATWPGVPCSLCGADAVGFYGKVDVPLVESEVYRNTTPAGHEGLALCWPCVCCFHALPYGCRLTGGPSAAVHSWDDEFLSRVTGVRFQKTVREIELGRPNKAPGRYENELVALVGLRRYELPVRAGVELLVFNNDNRGASIAGRGQLTLVDDDTVELSNLTRQFMFTEGDVGHRKVSRLSAALRERSQSTRIQEISRAIRGRRDLEELPRADLIVVSADSPGIVETVNRFCVERRLVFLNVCYVNDIAVWGPFVIPGETGCWSCRNILATPEGLGARSAEVIANINSCYQVPSFAPVNLLASSLALLDILMYLGRYGTIKSLNSRIGLWTHDLHFETQDCHRNPNCQVCGLLPNGKGKSDE